MTKYNSLILSYTNALLSVSEGKSDTIKEGVEFLLTLFREQSDIFSYLLSPIISLEFKKEIMLSMKEYLDLNLINFIIVVCLNKRCDLLLYILEKFLHFIRKKNNEIEITIKSAKALKDSDVQTITGALSSMGKIVKINNAIDPSILGGFIIRYDFNFIDVSLRSYLNRLVDLSQKAMLE
ncbi:MAG: ATP synthase F1 subunit delta [Wolbachia endosymbiont of Fragariocoptes setiger]|nr:ATP synthase F1 subunit delta [Wolbachia endosymbiont of Fragariocoptes setiger]